MASAEGWISLIDGSRRGIAPALLRRSLWFARLPYGIGVGVRNKLFHIGWKHQRRASIPVISIGNLTLGGTGKTPCVEFVARFLKDQGYAAAILSRGYGSEGGRNDEALVLEDNLPDVPHLQGPDRAQLAVTAAEELESEVVVLDDGFQHRRLSRDLDIVLIDATNPWGFGYLFPRGTLREGLGSLHRAGMIILTRCDAVSPEELDRIDIRLRRLGLEVPVAKTCHGPREWIGPGHTAPPEACRGRPMAAFCGIGNPQGFRHTLRTLGADVRDFRIFPDHHPYSREDVEGLRTWAAGLPADAMIATTQKDWVKLRMPELAGRPLWALRIGLEFLSGQEILEVRLLGIMSRKTI